jgi:hypothetical protein
VEHVAFLMIAVPRVSVWMCVDVLMCISQEFARVHEFDIRACAAEAGGIEPLIHCSASEARPPSMPPFWLSRL